MDIYIFFIKKKLQRIRMLSLFVCGGEDLGGLYHVCVGRKLGIVTGIDIVRKRKKESERERDENIRKHRLDAPPTPHPSN